MKSMISCFCFFWNLTPPPPPPQKQNVSPSHRHIISLVSDTLGLEGVVFHWFWTQFCINTLLLHWFRTRWVWNVLFFQCSDNISCRHVINTQGKQHVPNPKCCFHCVLITCHADMSSKHKEDITFQIQRVVSLSSENMSCSYVIRT